MTSCLSDTLEYYKENAEAFVLGTLTADMSDARTRFLARLQKEAYILDFGCGSGRDAKAFLEAGYQVDATDGSEEVCQKATDYTGIPVKHMLFSDLNAVEQYDGVWACASILHLPKGELYDVMKRISIALKQDGVLYTSFKYGSFEGMKNGRYFTNFTKKSLTAFMRDINAFKTLEMWITRDVRPGRENEKWINILARRI